MVSSFGSLIHAAGGRLRIFGSKEFEIRADFQPAIDIIRSATIVGAKLVNMPDEIGCVSPGAYADLIVVERDPLEDVRVLTIPEKFRYVVSGGELVIRHD